MTEHYMKPENQIRSTKTLRLRVTALPPVGLAVYPVFLASFTSRFQMSYTDAVVSSDARAVIVTIRASKKISNAMIEYTNAWNSGFGSGRLFEAHLQITNQSKLAGDSVDGSE